MKMFMCDKRLLFNYCITRVFLFIMFCAACTAALTYAVRLPKYTCMAIHFLVMLVAVAAICKVVQLPFRDLLVSVTDEHVIVTYSSNVMQQTMYSFKPEDVKYHRGKNGKFIFDGECIVVKYYGENRKIAPNKEYKICRVPAILLDASSLVSELRTLNVQEV